MIARAVEAVMLDTGLRPTRNRTRRTKEAPQSACSIVAEQLGSQRIQLGEDAVEKIWSAYFKMLGKSHRQKLERRDEHLNSGLNLFRRIKKERRKSSPTFFVRHS
jgi:hypothetical protein